VRTLSALARLFRTRELLPHAFGTEAELDGASVVAACEAMLGSVPAEDAATALGLALAGVRTTCMIAGADGDAAVPAIRSAAGRQAPFVAHLFARAAAVHATARGTGHESVHALADAGAFVLVAQNPGDAAWLTIAARCVAERALVPGVVVLDEEEIARRTATVALPPAELVEELAGRPGDYLNCPTHAQRFLFGEVRRRVPRWVDRDEPALLGPVAGSEAWAAGAAGRRPWVGGRVRLLLQEEFERLADRTGVRFESAPATGLDGAGTLLVAMGSLVETARRVAARVREEGGPRVGVLGIRVLRPFPGSAIADVLREGRRVLVLERADAPLAGEPPLTREVRAALERASAGRRSRALDRVVTVLAGAGGQEVRDEDLRAVLLEPPDESEPVVSLGLAFVPGDANHPKRQALHDRIARDDPGVRSLGRRASTAPAADARPKEKPALSPAVRRRGPAAADWSSLPRFWDQVGVLYHEGREAELSPDPQLALGAVPALSAGFRDRSRNAGGWPTFDPSLCTGCGLCWTLCPDGAIGVAALGVREILDAGLERARGRGRAPDVLRSVLAPLASAAEARIRVEAPARLADTLPSALDEVLARTSPPAERRAGIVAALDAVLEEIGELSGARTAPFFDEAPPGKGALLALAVDPAACQSCGVCVAACEPGALAAADAAEPRRARDLAGRDRVAELPAPSVATLERVGVAATPGPAAALLLSGEGRSPLVAGDASEPGSGVRLALRLVLAAAVAHVVPRRAALLTDLDELRAKLAEEIRHGLLDAVPTNDLDAIAGGLRALGGADVDVADLVKRLEEACDSPRVDAEVLAALVNAAKEVANLRDACARTGSPPVPPPLVLAGESLEGMVTFPHNPFAGPVVVAGERQAAPLALGLARGVGRDTASGAGVVRRARATLAQPRAPVERSAPAWDELEDAERVAAPPVILALTDVAWGRQELAAVDALLGASQPIVVVVLSDAPPRPSPALAALARPDVFVLQSSIAFPDHLVEGLAGALAGGRPAFVHVLAPSPAARAVAPERLLELARLPVEERAFPLLRRDPRDGSARLTLDGNPETATGESRPADLAVWGVLNELAGVAGPVVERAREEGRAAERDGARSEWEPRVDAAARREREELARRLTSRLIALSAGPDDEGTR